MSMTLGAATKLLDNMMVNYSEWHTERAPQGKNENSVEETSSLSDKIDTIMSMLASGARGVRGAATPFAGPAPLWWRLPWPQIGRASCRERVSSPV